MPKMKSKRGAAKRFRKTAGKDIKRAKGYRRHLLTSKSRKRKRDLRLGAAVHRSDVRSVKRMLPS